VGSNLSLGDQGSPSGNLRQPFPLEASILQWIGKPSLPVVLQLFQRDKLWVAVFDKLNRMAFQPGF
jgi:hypothetical protein